MARLRNRRFFSLAELNAAIRELVVALNDRVTRHLGASRRQLFEDLERPALKPLPAAPYVYAEWAGAPGRARLPCRGRRPLLLGAPPAAAPEGLGAPDRAHGRALPRRPARRAHICAARRDRRPHHGARAHAVEPPALRRLDAGADPREAAAIGPTAEALVAAILRAGPIPSRASAPASASCGWRAIHGAERLEAACRRALEIGARSYSSVNSILKNRLDRRRPDPAADGPAISAPQHPRPPATSTEEETPCSPTRPSTSCARSGSTAWPRPSPSCRPRTAPSAFPTPTGSPCCSTASSPTATPGASAPGSAPRRCAMSAPPSRTSTTARARARQGAVPAARHRRWIEERRNLLITGPCGVGKTWLACALGQKACRDNRTVLYQRLPRLFAELELAHGDGRFPRLFRSLVKADLLILDDWGPDRLTASQRRDLMEIVEDRCGTGSTLVTSQLPVDAWHAVIDEPTFADAILDRLVHNAYRLDLDGPSMRKLKAGDELPQARP